MSWPLQWGMTEIRALLEVRRDSHSSFGEYIGASAQTVARWERGEQKPTHKQLLKTLDDTLERLEPWQREWFDKLRDQAPESSLGPIAPDVGSGEEDQADRRTAGKVMLGGIAAALVPLDAFERIREAAAHPVDSKLIAAHEDLADTLASLHWTTGHDVLAGQVVHHADILTRLLDRPIVGADRQRLEAVTASSCAQAGMLAWHLNDRATQRRYFALARTIADDSGDDRLRAQALTAARIQHSPIEPGGPVGCDGRAVKLMRHAVYHAQRADRTTRAFAQHWLGLELAASGDERGFLEACEIAAHLAEHAQPAGSGFFARSQVLTPSRLSWTTGTGLVRAGRAAEALQALRIALSSSGQFSTVIARAETAAAWVLQAEPEPACQELDRALDLTLEAGYAKGFERILGVRGRFPDLWAELPYVRELDDRLRDAGRILLGHSRASSW